MIARDRRAVVVAVDGGCSADVVVVVAEVIEVAFYG